MIVVKPGLIPKFRNIVKSEAPKTISGVAIGKKIKRFVLLRPLKLYRPKAKAMSVPRIVAITVEMTPIFKELPRAEQISGAPHGFCQFLRVKPFQTKLERPASLNEKANV
jgi:hypothetical protein